jgi:hypothetical protein
MGVRLLLRAELLKLRRHRPLIALAAVLSTGAVVAFQAFLQIRHATTSSPQINGPAGGEAGMTQLLKMQGLYFGAIASILIGAEAGTADLASGVFRDLVATGRSRLTLFWVRLPAALIISLSFTMVAYALGVAGLFFYADGLIGPTGSQILEGLGWVLLANGAVTALALGVGSLTGSRALTLTAVVGWQTIGTLLLMREIPNPQFLLNTALGRLSPLSLVPARMGELTALAVIAAWGLVPTLAGARRTGRQDA